MKDNYVIDLDEKRYMLLEDVEYQGYKYYSAVEIKDKNKMTKKYTVLKRFDKGQDMYFLSVQDKKELQPVVDLLTAKLVKECQDLVYKPGSIVEMDGKKYIIMDYIIHNNDAYMVSMTKDKPVDVKVSKVIGFNEGEGVKIQDVNGDTLVKVMQLFTAKYDKVNK